MRLVTCVDPYSVPSALYPMGSSQVTKPLTVHQGRRNVAIVYGKKKCQFYPGGPARAGGGGWYTGRAAVVVTCKCLHSDHVLPHPARSTQTCKQKTPLS